MLIENSGIAAIIPQVQRCTVLLIYIACACCSSTTNKLLQTAAMIIMITLAGIIPLCTVLQQHICITAAVFIENSALKIRFIGIHTQCQYTVVFLQVLNQDIAFNLHITVAYCCCNLAVF